MELIDELTKNEGEKEENQRNIIDNLSKLTDIKANLSAYIAKKETLLENIKQDNEKLADLTKNKEALAEEFNSLNKLVTELENSKSNKEKNVNSIENLLLN